MNEKIKELWNQASGEFCKQNPYATIMLPAPLREKFAELIVRECADACYKHKDVESFGIYPIRVAMVTKACSDNIKQHFRVEE